MAREQRATVLIVGGGLGGVAAALAASDRGADVLLVEKSGWLGGQLTAQAVPLDEHPWIEGFGCTARYRRLRDGIREHYRAHHPLTASARARAGAAPPRGGRGARGRRHRPGGHRARPPDRP